MMTMTNLFVLVTIIIIGIIGGCIENEKNPGVEAKVISLNRTVEELVYVNPPFVISGNVSYYDVLVGNETITIKSEKELSINSTIKVNIQNIVST